MSHPPEPPNSPQPGQPDEEAGKPTLFYSGQPNQTPGAPPEPPAPGQLYPAEQATHLYSGQQPTPGQAYPADQATHLYTGQQSMPGQQPTPGQAYPADQATHLYTGQPYPSEQPTQQISDPQQPYTAAPQAYSQNQPYTPGPQPYAAADQGYPPPGQYPPGQPGPYTMGQYPQTQGYPPGQIPPGQIPPYGTGGPSGSGGGGTNIPLIIAVALVGLIVVGVAGYFILRPSHHSDNNVATGTSTSSAPETTTSDMPTTTTEMPTTAANVWIAAIYNENTHQVSWAKSTIGSADAQLRAENECGTGCGNAAWAENECIAIAIGGGDGWGSSGGTTAIDAQNKAINIAETKYNVQGPFHTWSKCTTDN
ncbi:hypothetical protein ABIA39_006899 [Nocardia sp. GAS34]|uniref:DUF4189 domain-containing protein n=1 Tax=unclassified Nocardia TaxID=2637762 RepID=UPI003D1FE382